MTSIHYRQYGTYGCYTYTIENNVCKAEQVIVEALKVAEKCNIQHLVYNVLSNIYPKE